MVVPKGNILSSEVIEKPKERFLSDGKPMKVEALNDTTVRFSLNVPMPALASMFAQDYAQPFQPKHLLEKFHPKLSKNADKLAKSLALKMVMRSSTSTMDSLTGKTFLRLC